MLNTHCVVKACKTTNFNKTPGVSFHSFPSNPEIRSKWLGILKNKCQGLDWRKSKICSKHFEKKYFDSQRKLKDNAVPTLFPLPINQSAMSKSFDVGPSKIDKLLDNVSQAELTSDIKASIARLKEPSNIMDYINDDLKSKSDAPIDVKLWLLIKKQNNLNNRLLDQTENNLSMEMLQKELKETKTAQKEMESIIESNKYVIKSLQEKQSTLEEQIEILTAVESR